MQSIKIFILLISYDPEYVLVISGDHIYQMDYHKLLEHHKQTEADATISVIPVPWEEASRFGILNTTEDLRIYEFDEKPKEPKSNLASMGIYIFTLVNFKILFNGRCRAINIPVMILEMILFLQCLVIDLKLYAYRFEGYWKDVGTVQSYWEANMDLLDEDWSISLNNKNWRIYSNDSNFPPQYIGETAVVKHSLINQVAG